MVFNSKEYNKQYSIKYNDAHVKQRLLSLAKYRAKKQ